MFRGICVDNKDPKNLGRIRVQVPQILGTAASGWAFPAWSFNETILWPQDRLPKSGDGVWVMFDSTSPDKMIWLAAFGALPLINQPEYVEMPDFKSTLTMVMGNAPIWNTTCQFTGELGSDDGGVPNPNPVVLLSGRKVGGDWVVLDTVEPLGNGTWTINHIVQLTGEVEYRAVFEGTGVYGAVSSDPISATTPLVTFPTTLTMSMVDPAPALNKTVVFSGKLTTGGGPPAGYGVPKPNAKVNLMVRTTGSWQAVVSNIAVALGDGTWSTNYLITIPGAVDYQAVFNGVDIFLPSQSSILTINTSVGTSVSAPVLPALTNGSGFNVSGTIKVAASGANVTAGMVELWWRHTAGGDQSWRQSGATHAVTAGTYSLTHPSLTVLGGTEWQVRYLGSTNFDPANSTAAAGTVNLPAAGAMTKGSAMHTTVSFSWSAISGATEYEVLIWNNSQWILKETKPSNTLSTTIGGLSADTQYFWSVRAKATNNAGTVVYGAQAANISNKTGHPAVAPSTGTSGWIALTSTTFRCHRKDTGWQGSGDYEMRQSYYSTPYSSDGYMGIAKYGGSTVRDAIIAAIGATAHANGSCSACQITLYRTPTASSPASPTPTVNFYTTTSEGSGARPVTQGTAVKIYAQGFGASKTFDIGTEHGQALGTGAANSVMIYRSDANEYIGLNGQGTNGGKLELKWTYSYGGTAYVAPAWL